MPRGFSKADIEWALQGAEVGVWDWDIARDEIHWSREMGRIFGIAPEAYPTRVADYAGCLHPDDRAMVQATLESAMRSRTTSFSVEHRVLRSDGSVRWVRGAGRLELDESGAPVRLGGTAVDITAEKEALAAVHKSAEQFRLFSELASDYVYEVDASHGLPLMPIVVVGSFERTTGYTPEQVMERGGWLKVIHPDDVSQLDAVFDAANAGKPFIAEYRIVRPDGEVRWLRDHIRPIMQDGALAGMVGGVQDITERKSLEERLNHAQRMEALARLASGVAHDFNNMLLVITASLGLLRESLHGDVGALSLTGEIDDACTRAAELTRSLLAFGRKNLATAEPVLLGEALRSTRSMLERAAGEKIGVAIDIVDGAGRVDIDVGQFQLCLLNLTMNAKAAMPEGGRLSILLRPGTREDEPILELGSRPFVVLEVSDTGTGIAPSVLPHIFEPFFTTKGPALGTGLGLATCHGIIAQAGGSLRVTSELGRGATFRAYLPVTTRVPSKSLVGLAHGHTGGTERILFVDDDPIVLRLVTRILEQHGYAVRSAGTIQEARALAAAHPFDALVSDVRLPDGDGAALAVELRASRPTLPVLLISGFVDDDARATIATHRFRLLAKPFGREAVARCLRAVLDESAADGVGRGPAPGQG